MGTVSGGSQLRNNLGQFLTTLNSKLLAEAESMASEIEGDMKSASYAQQRWEDRTGDARQLLSAKAYFVGSSGEAGDKASQKSAIGQLNTPRARDGSYSQSTPISQGIMIIARGDSDHNLWLEIAMGARFAVIRPTLEAFGSKIPARLQAVIASF